MEKNYNRSNKLEYLKKKKEKKLLMLNAIPAFTISHDQTQANKPILVR